MATKLHNTDIPKRLELSLTNNNVTFFTAPPAYGKSVLLCDLLSKSSKKSIITFPNRTSVMLMYEYVTKLYPDRKIGYKISGDSSNGYNDLTLMTTGYFIEWITYNKKVLEYPINVAIDEAHVCDEQTDSSIRFLLWYKKFNKKLKIILSSATLNIDRFANGIISEMDIISFQEKSFNVDVQYIPIHKTKILELIKDKLVGINTLIICSGENEIYAILSMFEECHDPIFNNLIVKPLFSKLDNEDKSDALNVSNGWNIIISTDIVESSITIDGIDAVIDIGKRKISYMDENGKITLKEETAAKSNIIQALNRCGRKEKQGKGYVLMEEWLYKELRDHPEPEVYRNPFYTQIFRSIRANIPIAELLWEEEHQKNLNADMMNIISHGIIKIENDKYKLTELGKIVSKLQLSLLSNKFLIDVVLHDDPDLWYYGLLISTWVDLSDPIFYKPKAKYKEPDDKYESRCNQIRILQEKYKIGVDCLDEVLLIVGDIFIFDDNKNYISVDINNNKLKISGLNAKCIKTWRKLINFTAAGLYKEGYSVKRLRGYNHENSEILRRRLSPYLYSSFRKSFYRTTECGTRGALIIDNNSDYHYNDNTGCNSTNENYYIFGLNTFSMKYKAIISKVIRYSNPILSSKEKILFYENLIFPVELWEEYIFKHLSVEDTMKVFAASRM